MREVTTRVYKFDELTDAAKERAVAVLREKLGGDWWDSGDNEDVKATMIYTLAEKLGTPGWDTFGVADFPGIDGLTVDGWDVERHQALAVSGTLTRANAPALPWVDDVDQIKLTGHRSEYTSLDDGCPIVAGEPATTEQIGTLLQAVREALSAAWTAGEKEAEYKTGEEYARQTAENHEFTEDGELYA